MAQAEEVMVSVVGLHMQKFIARATEVPFNKLVQLPIHKFGAWQRIVILEVANAVSGRAQRVIHKRLPFSD